MGKSMSHRHGVVIRFVAPASAAVSARIYLEFSSQVRQTEGMKYSQPFLAAVAASFLCLSASSRASGSATWNLNPTSGTWFTASNWTPANIPNTISDTAPLGVSNITTLTNAPGGFTTSLGSFVFIPGASAYTINFDNVLHSVASDSPIGSGTGSGAVTVANGTLSGSGTVGGPTTIGDGRGPRAFLEPAAGAKTPSILTIESPIVLKNDAVYIYRFKARNQKSLSDQVVANE